MLIKCRLLFLDLCRSHFRESEIVLLNISDAEVVNFCHRKAFGWTHAGTQSTKATLCHVNVELCCIDTFWCSVRCFAKLLDRPYRLDRDTIHRTDLCTLVTDYAVINFIMKAVTAIDRNRQNLMRILNGSNAVWLLKIS